MPVLDVRKSLKLVEKYGIPTARHVAVHQEQELEAACRKLAYPVVLKIISPEINHKTDAGGIKLNIHSLDEAQQAFRELQQLPGFQGVLVQEHVHGREVIVGGKQDAQFGPTLVFGMGGIFVEVFKDASVRLCPITRKDAQEMLREIKGHKILEGVRGQKKANLEAIQKVLLQASMLMQREKIQELDINPVMVNEKKAIAVDARIVV